MEPTPTASEFVEQVVRGLPGELFRMVMLNPLAWLGFGLMVALAAVLGDRDRRLKREERARRRRRSRGDY